MIQIAKNYRFRATPGIRHGVTPPDQIEEAVLAIAGRWNDRLPQNRCRILTDQRFRDLQACLEVLTVEQVLKAIDCYARQDWNRRKRAWRTFDHWFEYPNVLAWYERACDLEEAKSSVAPLGPGQLRTALAKIGKHTAEQLARQDQDTADCKTVAAMAMVEHQALMEQAAKELLQLRRNPAALTPFALQQQALVISTRPRPSMRRKVLAKSDP